MKFVSIEFAHLYIDGRGEGKIRESCRKANEYMLDHSDEVFSIDIMLDDYSPVVYNIEEGEYLKVLSSYGLKPYRIVYESELIREALKLVNILPDNKLTRQTKEWMSSTSKVPCSLFVAAWYMMRLGDERVTPVVGVTGKDEIVNILSNDVEDSERKALKLLKYLEVDTSRITNIYV